ncbi:hypothetical protein L0F63_000899, partial [Massospora cicadina]
EQDLTIHLECAQTVHHSPLVLPHSQLHFDLWVKYGELFSYAEKSIIDMAQVVMLPASFIDFYPYKEYFDLSFTCETDAAIAATVLLVFQGALIPTTRTWIPTDATMVVQFEGLPTHLIPMVLHQELIEGLATYGSNPILQFVVPNEAS